MDRIDTAADLMERFAARTGLTSDWPPRRYLWTDAHAVCNGVGLARATGEGRFRDLALRLVEQVHRVLGRHREDDRRRGWISGLGEEEGARHPTRGGLRIGKELPERTAGERFDERLEWERDGQYFHYLTRWMHALDAVARDTGEARFSLWARELAAAAYGGFVYRPAGGGAPRMHWKMSIDLSRPLVPSMGHHDPLDGYLTALQLRETARSRGWEEGPELTDEIEGFAALVAGRDWTTSDPLGLGGLLIDAWRAAHLRGRNALPDPSLVDTLLAAAAAGLRQWTRQGDLRRPAATRLAFRELGLAMGLHAFERLRDPSIDAALPADLDRHLPMAEEIESFWLAPDAQSSPTFTGHQDINEVMLATALAPDGYLYLD